MTVTQFSQCRFVWTHRRNPQDIAAILQGAATVAWQNERHVEEMYGGHTIVQAFNQQDDSIERFYVINGMLSDSAWKSQFFTSIMQPMSNLSQPRLRHRLHSGGYLAVKRLLNRRYSSVYPVCEKFHSTHHATCINIQYTAADHRRSGTRVRISR